MSERQGCRDLPPPLPLLGSLRLGLRLHVMAGLADRLEVAACIRAAFSLRDDVVNLSCRCNPVVLQAGLAQSFVTSHYCIALTSPRATTTARSSARYPRLMKVLMLFTVTMAGRCLVTAGRCSAGAWRLTRHCGSSGGDTLECEKFSITTQLRLPRGHLRVTGAPSIASSASSDQRLTLFRSSLHCFTNSSQCAM